MVELVDCQRDAGDIRDLIDEFFVAGKRRRVEEFRREAAHADGVADRENVFAAAHGDFFSAVAVRLSRNVAAVQLALESRIVIDLRVDLQRHAVAQMIHSARRHRQSERECFQDARVVRIALRQPFDGHQILERRGRIVALFDSAG